MSLTDAVGQDVKGALRGLWKSPGFTVAALVTLSLGIGATSAIFSVVNAVLLTPLPYEAPERRVMVWSKWISFDKTWVSNAEVLDYQRMSRTMTDVAAWGTAQQNLTGDGEAVRIGVGLVTANTFDVLGARPLLGRVISAEEDRPGSPPAVVLGHGLWQTRYGGDPAVVGRTLMINDVPAAVVGVMPEGFRLPTDFTVDAAEPTQLWRPLQIDPQNLARGSHGYYAAAVLAQGQSPASATSELQAIARQLTEQGLYHEAMQFSAFAVAFDDEIRGEVRPAMWLLMGGVAFLLLIACVNVANLLLVRGDARLREMAVRTAMGAAPRRLVRQLFTESVVLALLGAGLGLALAAGALRVLTSVDPTSLPPLAPVGLDATVIAFTLVLSVLTTLLFGLAPALRTLRVNLVESLREGGQNATIGSRRQRIRGALVATEMTLAVVLVIGAGLMIRSLDALGRIDLGFNPDGVLTLRVGVPATRYDTPGKVIDFYRQATDRLRSLPGVEHAGVVRVLPLATTIGDWGLDVEGFDESPGRNAKGDWQIVSDGAFEAMGMRLVRGRWFTPADTTDGALIAVVNETMAQTYWTDPGAVVGGRIRTNANRPWLTVVGIVADERHNGVTGAVKEKFYVPHSQWHLASGNIIRNAFIVVRTSGDPLALAGAARGVIRDLDSNVPLSNVRTMNDVLRTALATPRLTGFLLAAFAAIALALAAVGIYGVLAYLVSQRTQEIGIRLAIGADRFEVLMMILRQGLTLAVGGVAVGVAAAFLLTRLMQNLLYEVKPADPVTFIAVPLILLLVSLIASYVPARRATNVSPLIALRTQ
ncbi:MAG TPA: ABC transporter permease [Vicinamibacterales bacterium]|nr:ABC transporter permease [Vicinamibacterales bacterium]